MHPIILVMSGGAIGAAARYESGRLAMRHLNPDYPWGTLLVNIIGGFLMGLLAGWLVKHPGDGGEALRLFAGVGILGGFTTFSAFSLDAWMMLERGAYGSALGYVLASVIVSILALAIGFVGFRSIA